MGIRRLELPFDSEGRSGTVAVECAPSTDPLSIGEVGERRGVRPLVGFEWGFDISPAGSIGLRSPARLDLSAWNHRVPMLRTTYPTWAFAEVR